MAELMTAENGVALLTLTALEIVLGIDNVIFIAILSGKLPESQRARTRTLGIAAAVITRLLLLFSITWVMRLSSDLFSIMGNGLSGRDLILLVGGLFLIGKSTAEIYEKLEMRESGHEGRSNANTMLSVILQIMLIDIIFSLDSVITAVGISGELIVMVPAILVAAAVMLFFAGSISDFVERHPSMKILALAFLILIGTLLVVEGWNAEAAHEMGIKNYAYFAMFFSVVVEMINIRVRKEEEPVHLHNVPHLPDDDPMSDGGAA